MASSGRTSPASGPQTMKTVVLVLVIIAALAVIIFFAHQTFAKPKGMGPGESIDKGGFAPTPADARTGGSGGGGGGAGAGATRPNRPHAPKGM